MPLMQAMPEWLVRIMQPHMLALIKLQKVSSHGMLYSYQ